MFENPFVGHEKFDATAVFEITIKGATRNERQRILGLLGEAIRADGKYLNCRGSYPFEGDESLHGYAPIDQAKVYADMSVDACASRYDADRQETLNSIRAGNISASMSGIEYKPKWAKDLGDDDMTIKTMLTWNGQVHIDRPTWRAEYDAWVATPAN